MEATCPEEVREGNDLAKMSAVAEITRMAGSGRLLLRALVITDWRDGPLEGITRLSLGPQLWVFRLIAEAIDAEHLDDRVFELALLEDDATRSRLEEVTAPFELPAVWPFDDLPESTALRSVVDGVLDGAPGASLMLNSVDFHHVIKAWVIPRGSPDVHRETRSS
jgi:hypothetical protein